MAVTHGILLLLVNFCRLCVQSQRYEGMLTMMKTNRSQIEETNLLFSRLSQSRDTRTADLERLHNDLTVTMFSRDPLQRTSAM